MLEVSDFKKIFVVGCPRSGTTWLTKMLEKHPLTISSQEESHTYSLIYEPFSYLQKMKLNKRLKRWEWIIKYYGLIPIFTGITEDDLWKGIIRAHQLWKRKSKLGLSCLIEKNELEELIKSVRKEPYDNLTKAKLLIDRIFTLYFEKQGGDYSNYFLEKTPFHIKYVDIILELYPEAKAIEIVRDGRDVCASWQAFALKERWARKSTLQITKIWNKCIALGNKCYKNPSLKDRIYRIRYEDLRNDTQNELGKVFDFIGLSFDEFTIKSIVEALNINNIKEKGKGKLINKGIIGNWKTSLTKADIAVWKENEEAKNNLISLGYSL